MYVKTREIPVEVEMNRNKLPSVLIVKDEQGERQAVVVEKIYFQDALRSSYQSYFRVSTEIYAYRYKVHVSFHQCRKSCTLLNIVEDDSWVLKV